MPATQDDRIPITSAAELAVHFRSIQDALAEKETEHSWQRLDRALFKLEAITKGGAYKYEDFVAFMKSIAGPLARSLLSERTKLSGTAADVISSVAPRLAERFDQLGSLYVPPLLSLCSRTNKVAQKRAEKCLQLISKHCKLSSTLPLLCEACKDKSGILREVAMACIITLLDNAGSHRLDRRVGDIESTIRIAARDSNPQVRQYSRRLFESYIAAWPARVESFTAQFSPTTRRYLPLPKVGDLPVAQPIFSPPRPHTQPHDPAPHSDPPPSTPSNQPRAAPQPLEDTPRTKRAQFLEQLAAAKARSKTQAAISSHVQSTGALKGLNAATMYGGPPRPQFSRSVPPSAEAGPSNLRRQEEYAAATTSTGKPVRGAKPSASASASPVLRQDVPLPAASADGLGLEKRSPTHSSEEDVHQPPSELLSQRMACTLSNEDAPTRRLPERVIVPHDEQQQLSKSRSGLVHQQQHPTVTKTPGPKAARVQVTELGPSSTRPTAARIASTERTREDGRSKVEAAAKTKPATTAGVQSKAKAGVMNADKSKAAPTGSGAGAPPPKKTVAPVAKPETATATKPVPTTGAPLESTKAAPAAAPRPAVKKKPTSPSKPLPKTTSSTSKALVGAKSRALAKGPNAATTTTTTAGMARDAIMAARQAEVAKLKAENKARCEMAKLSAAAVHAAKRAKARSGRLGEKQMAPKKDHEGKAQKEIAPQQVAEQVAEEPEPFRVREDTPTTTTSQPADEVQPTASLETSEGEEGSQHGPTWSPSRFSPRRLNVGLPPQTPGAKCPSSPLMPLGQHTPFKISRGAALGSYSSPAEKLMKSLGATPRQPLQNPVCELNWENGEDQENRPPAVAAGGSEWSQEM